MPGAGSHAAFGSAEWLRRATAWMDERLAAAGRERRGDVLERVMPWSRVLQAPTADGDVWLKASRPGTTPEAAVYTVLVHVAPGAVLAPIAIDAARDWVLLPDGGPSLHEVHRGPGLAAAMAVALPAYVALQRASAHRVAELIDAGVPDMRPAVLPARLDEALELTAPLAERAGAGERHRAVSALRQAFSDWCAELASLPGGVALDHGDLHAGNVLERERFYDWGDACVAHPFTSLDGCRRALWQQGATDSLDAPPVTDAYLGCWADLADRTRLDRALDLASRVGPVIRCLTWHRALAGLDDAGPWQEAPWRALGRLLDAR